MSARQRTRRKRLVKGTKYAANRQCGARLGELRCGVLRIHHTEMLGEHIDFRASRGRDYATWPMVAMPTPILTADHITARELFWSKIKDEPVSASEISTVEMDPELRAQIIEGAVTTAKIAAAIRPPRRDDRSRLDRILDWFAGGR